MEFWTVEQCCDILDSQRVPVTESERVKGRYPYYGANGVQDHVADFLFDDELVLVAEDGGNFGSTTKPIAYRVSGKCWVNNHAHVLKPHEDVNVDYLCYALMYYPVGNMVNGTTRKKLNQADLRKMKVPVRPVEAQEDIVRNIQNTETAIENRKRVLALLDELVKSRFVEMFEKYADDLSIYRPLKEVCGFIDYRGKTPEKSGKGIPLITAKNVKENHFSVEPQEFIPADNYEKVMTRGFPRANDILFTTEAPLGNVCRIPDIYERFCVGQRILTIQPAPEYLISEYLEHELLSERFQQKVRQKSTGSTVVGIRSKLLVELKVPVPPLPLQQKFAAFVHQVDATKAAAQEEITALETLRGKMMQEFFGVRAGVRAEG